MAERKPGPAAQARRPRRSGADRAPGGEMTRRDALRITAVAGLSAAFGGSIAAGLLRDARLHRMSETRTRMGTLVTLRIVHPDPAAARAMIDAAFTEMARLEDVLSRHRPDADLGRLNAHGSLPGAPTELVAVLTEAVALARDTGGAFDPTVLPVLELHRRVFAATGGPPPDREIHQALRLVDYREIGIEDSDVVLRRPGMAVTLDGIAKGYVVDRTVDVLVGRGAERVLVDAGGDMSTGGSGSMAEPWTVAVQDPRRAENVAAVVRLGGESIATSGDYLGTFTSDRRFHDVIDPRTGSSPVESSSVSVVAGTAMMADALSTAIMVLGAENGLELLSRRGDAEGLVVTKDGERLRTEGFDDRLG